MLRLFRSIHITPLFFLPLICIVLWFPGFFKSDFLAIENSGILSSIAENVLSSFPHWLLVLFSIILVTAEAIYLDFVVKRHEVLFKPSHLPALMYVMLMSFNNDVINFNIILLVNLLLIFICDRIFSLFKNENSTALIFDCGFLIAIVSMFYLPFILCVLFMIIGLIIMRPFSVREWLVGIVGFVLPYFFLAIYFFMTDKLQTQAQSLMQQSIFGIPKQFSIPLHKEAAYFLFISYLAIISFIAMVRARANFYKNSVKTRSTQQVLIFLTMILLVEGFFLQKTPLHFFLQLAVPLSVFLSYLYSSAKQRLWIYEISLWVFFALIVKSYF